MSTSSLFRGPRITTSSVVLCNIAANSLNKFLIAGLNAVGGDDSKIREAYEAILLDVEEAQRIPRDAELEWALRTRYFGVQARLPPAHYA